jgi:flavin reductase (DIM6/NTAB) family NADH-FMN oxidoreductase RutF/flavodoxin
MDEARRYYANIVGKYGAQVQSLLSKAQAHTIEMICPLHGFVWRRNLSDIISKYQLWSKYQPEEKGVMIAYASVYGNTENTAEILASRLRDNGVKTVMFDVSVTPASEIIAAAFRWSHLVFASTTYNAGIFVSMEELLSDLVAHNIQNRTVAIIENGSWAATSGNLIRQKLEKCKNITILDQTVSLKSSLKALQLAEIDAMVNALMGVIPAKAGIQTRHPCEGRGLESDVHAERLDSCLRRNDGMGIDPAAMFKLQYGLFILSAKDGAKDNGCVINVASQITVSPVRIAIAVNKVNYTHDMVLTTGEFNLSVLAESVPFRIFEHFGFHSGRDTDKFAGVDYAERAANGICYVSQYTNCMISAKVVETYDSGTHSVFLADVTQAIVLSAEPSVSYQYYFDHIKPKPQPPQSDQKGFECKICGYIHEGDSLPEDFICPLCKHGADVFEPL